MKRVTRALVCVLAAAVTVVLGASTAHAGTSNYQINLTTCDEPGAGTDADVSALLAGPDGTHTEWVVLNNNGNDRERGQTDIYNNLILTTVFPVSAVYLDFNDHNGEYTDWCLDKITVYLPHQPSIHPFHDWLRVSGTYRFPAQ